MKTIYLAGPMTGLPDYNYPEFTRVATLIRERGHTVINPAELFDGSMNLPRSTYMKYGIKNVLDADLVAVLDGWESSRGAQLEVEVANECGIPVAPYRLVVAVVDLKDINPTLWD